jgi:hypothetical protein
MNCLTPEASFSAYRLSYDCLTVSSVKFYGFLAITQPKLIATNFRNLLCVCNIKTRLLRHELKGSDAFCSFYRWSMETRLKPALFFYFWLSMLPQGVLMAFIIIMYHVDHFCTAFNMVLGQYLPNITLISTVLAVLRAARNRTRSLTRLV